MVECHLAKVDVEGSNPFSRSRKTATYRAIAGWPFFGFWGLPTTFPPRRAVLEKLAVLGQRDDRSDSRLNLPLGDGAVEVGHLVGCVAADLLPDDRFDIGVAGEVLEGSPHCPRGDPLAEPDRLSHLAEWLVQRRRGPEATRLRRELKLPRFRGHPSKARECARSDPWRTSESEGTFTPEFKAEAVRLCKVGDRSVAQVAKDLDLTETALRELGEARGDRRRQGPAGSADDGGARGAAAQLRRENKRLEMEREILKKAAAFFAKENA